MLDTGRQDTADHDTVSQDTADHNTVSQDTADSCSTYSYISRTSCSSCSDTYCRCCNAIGQKAQAISYDVLCNLENINTIIDSIQPTITTLINTFSGKQDNPFIKWIQEQPPTTSTNPIQYILSQYK